MPGKASNVNSAVRQFYHMAPGDRAAYMLTIIDADALVPFEYVQQLESASAAQPNPGGNVYAAPVLFEQDNSGVPGIVRATDYMWSALAAQNLSSWFEVGFPISNYSACPGGGIMLRRGGRGAARGEPHRVPAGQLARSLASRSGLLRHGPACPARLARPRLVAPRGASSNGVTAPTCPSPAETARTVADLCSEGALCTLTAEGHPVGAPVAYSLDAAGNPVMAIPAASPEAAGLAAGARVSLLVTPTALPARRLASVALQGTAARAESQDGAPEGTELVVLQVESCRYYGGLDHSSHGVAVPGEEYRAAEPDLLRHAASELITTWNSERAEDIYRIVANHLGAPLMEMAYAELLWLDRLGLYVTAEMEGQAPQVVRVPFHRPVLDERDARSVVTMASHISWEADRNAPGAIAMAAQLVDSFRLGLATASLGDFAVVAAITGTLLALLFSLRRTPTYDLDKIPGPWKKALPLVGNVLDCLRPDFHRVLLEWADTYGGIYRMKFLWHDTLIVTDPAALAGIMGRGDAAIDKAALAYAPINKMCDPHGNANLLTSAATDSWKAIRKAVANIKKKYPLVLSRVNQLVSRITAQGPGASIDVDQAALRVTLDVIGLAGFGHDYDSVSQDIPPYDHLLRVLPRCFTEVMLRVANPLRPLFPAWFKYGPKGSAAFAMFQAEMAKLLDDLQARGPPAEDDTDIGSQLVRVMGSHPEISRHRILSEIGILFVEGFETTGHTTSWTLFNIATSPGVQERIADELDGLGLLVKPGCPPPRELEWEDLKALPFLTACAKEAMRMLPVVSVMGRAPTAVTRVGPFTVPPGTIVGTPLFAIHNTRHNWDAPAEFRPERWAGVPVETYVYNAAEAAARAGAGDAAAAASASKRGITFMPFSEGPRNCVGQSLAKMEVLTLLAKLCAHFTIELTPDMGGRDGVRSRESTHLTLQSAGTQGIRCHLHPRDRA
ncbi:CYP97C1 [Scenedesmus sp. PABB004]|nr:CYP97C1 [Scenedesmus sp. PABB004]